jgi:drug/metabolite transporter (DMT)-like permease
LFATTTWGSLFIVGKSVLAHVDPLWFTLLRYTLATALLAVLLALRPGGFPWAALRRHARPLALLGAAGYGVFSMLVLLGLSHSLPSHGSVVMATMPITTQLLRWALDGVRPTRAALAIGVLALAGVVVVSGVLQADAGTRSTLGGDLVALLGTLGWIVYTRGATRLPALDVLAFTGLSAVAAWPLLLAAVLLATALGVVPLPTVQALAFSWHALLYVAIVPTVAAGLAYNFGVRTVGLVAGTAFLNFVPVSVLLIGMALGHTPQPHELAGVAMVVAALGLHTVLQARPAPAAARRRTVVGARAAG